MARDITKDNGGSSFYVYACTEPGCGFVSTGHEMRQSAEARRAEHLIEHESGQVGEDGQ